MRRSHIKRITIITAISLILLAVILVTRMASEQNGAKSNMYSGKIVQYIMGALIENNFPVNRDDVFWKITANEIVRKSAHFVEYMLIGIFLATLLNLVTKKVWISFPTSVIICFALAYLDEYRQKFIDGRGSTWFDVRVDTYGSVLGIVIATVIFLICNKFTRYKAEIRCLEEKLKVKQ